MISYWNGNQSLLKTFWLLFIFGSIAIAVCISLLVLFAGVFFGFPAYSLAFISFLLFLLLNPFYIFCWVSVWRSSNNVKSIFLNLGVKIIVTIHIAYFSYSLSIIPELANELAKLYE